MAATFGLLSALNIGSLHAADITWHPGVMLNKAGTPRTETAPAGMFTLTSQGYAIRNYVFLGWSERRTPIVKTYGAESRIHTLHRVGESLSVSQNTTLYAVWAIDANNNGSPDYADNRAEVKHDSEFIRRTLADLEAKRRGKRPVATTEPFVQAQSLFRLELLMTICWPMKITSIWSVVYITRIRFRTTS